MTRPEWDFAYVPVRRSSSSLEHAADFVLASWKEVDPNVIVRAVSVLGPSSKVDALLLRAPLFWYRIRTADSARLDDVRGDLERAGVRVRYLTPSFAASFMLGPRPDFEHAPRAKPAGWAARAERAHAEENSVGRWFVHHPNGVGADRSVCGFGAGSRLAVIDDAARDVDALDLDAEIVVGDVEPSRASSHGASMVAWSVGSRGRSSARIEAFLGVAPDASPRLYYIPKPDRGALWLPYALVRAADDGADVIVCATYVEGMTSPMLDDALEFCSRLGRGGRGTLVVMPTGREISSAGTSLSASLTLGFGDPASDPRVLCVAPSGRDGGWFLWPDKLGKLRPFANRGPAVRIAAPGDDMAYPFSPGHRLGHAESSGASAVAAGVALLLLSNAPDLELADIHELLTETALAPNGDDTPGDLADVADVLPRGRDADGHDVKVGYGRVSAARACLAASDPVSFALIRMGEEVAARRYSAVRKTYGGEWYSKALGRWSARILTKDTVASHTLLMILRHLRLLAGHPDRREAHYNGVLARCAALLMDRLKTHAPPASAMDELERLHRICFETTRTPAAASDLENTLYRVACDVWDLSPARTTDYNDNER